MLIAGSGTDTQQTLGIKPREQTAGGPRTMATYSKADFNADFYNKTRPTYPETFYEALMAFHAGPRELLVDVGTGSGFVARALAPHFARVVATDLLPVMLKEAENHPVANVEYVVAPAEVSPPSVAPASVDMLTAAECLHWVDHEVFFREAARVIRPGGTLAYWFYVDPRFVDHPELDAVYDRFCYDDYMGPYWQQPGRNHLRNRLADVAFPSQHFTGLVHVDHEPRDAVPAPTPLRIVKQLSVAAMVAYAKSWSAYHAYTAANPDLPDVAEEFGRALAAVLGTTSDPPLVVEWATVFWMASRTR